jgi:hypothetical protein
MDVDGKCGGTVPRAPRQREATLSSSTGGSSKQPSAPAPIEVGVEGSPAARGALKSAVQQGEAHRNPVLAISTYMIPAVMTAAARVAIT